MSIVYWGLLSIEIVIGNIIGGFVNDIIIPDTEIGLSYRARLRPTIVKSLVIGLLIYSIYKAAFPWNIPPYSYTYHLLIRNIYTYVRLGNGRISTSMYSRPVVIFIFMSTKQYMTTSLMVYKNKRNSVRPSTRPACYLCQT